MGRGLQARAVLQLALPVCPLPVTPSLDCPQSPGKGTENVRVCMGVCVKYVVCTCAFRTCEQNISFQNTSRENKGRELSILHLKGI